MRLGRIEGLSPLLPPIVAWSRAVAGPVSKGLLYQTELPDISRKPRRLGTCTRLVDSVA